MLKTVYPTETPFCRGYTEYLFGMTLLHEHAQYICIVYAKYQKASVKALVQAEFSVYELFKHKHNPNLKAGYVNKPVILSVINF